MKFRNFIITLALPFIFSSLMLAQGNPQNSNAQVDRTAKHAQMLSDLKQELSLTAEQEAKVKKIMDERAAEMATERTARQQKTEAQKAERAENMKQAQEKQKQHNAKMKEILTADQYVKYLEMRQSKQVEMRGERKGKRQGEGRPMRKMQSPE